MEKHQTKELRQKKKVQYFTFNIVWIAILIVLSISAVLSSLKSEFFILSILTRSIMGVGIVLNGFYWVFSSYWPFTSKNMTVRKRRIGGILLIVVGLIAMITALMGYGFNGNPRFLWWEHV